MFPDDIRLKVFQQLRERDTRAFAHLLTPEVFSRAATRSGLRLGNNPRNLAHLAWLGIASAWPASVAPRSARHAKHDPRPTDPTNVTEEADAKARKHMTGSFWIGLILAPADRFEEQHPTAVRDKNFRRLARDGRCSARPAWRDLTALFGTAKDGSSRGRTEARMVLLEFPLVRSPWRYGPVPLAEGGRTVAARLPDGPRRDDLVLMDRGSWSYGRSWQIQDQGACFAIRLMAGVKPRTLRELGRDDRLVEGTPSDRRGKRQGPPASITPRVITDQVRGFRPRAVVTDVLDPEAIPHAEWAGLATSAVVGGVLRGGLYHRRWEIETALRELKVVQGMEGGPRRHTPEGVADAVAGHLVLDLLLRWLMVEAAAVPGGDPLRLSVTGALHELLDLSHALLTSSAGRVAEVLPPRLLERLARHRVAARPGRHGPHPHDTQVLNKGKGKRRRPSKLQDSAA